MWQVASVQAKSTIMQCPDCVSSTSSYVQVAYATHSNAMAFLKLFLALNNQKTIAIAKLKG